MKGYGKKGYGKNEKRMVSDSKMANASKGKVSHASYNAKIMSDAFSRPAGRTSWAAGYKKAGTDAC